MGIGGAIAAGVTAAAAATSAGVSASNSAKASKASKQAQLMENLNSRSAYNDEILGTIVAAMAETDPGVVDPTPSPGSF